MSNSLSKLRNEASGIPLDNLRHEQFAQLIAQGSTAPDAYIAAGFEAAHQGVAISSGSRLLNDPRVRRRVRELLAPGLKRNQASVDRLVDEYCRLAYSNMDDYLKEDAEGLPQFDYLSTTRAQRAAIAEITVEEYMDGRGDDARQVKRVKFKLHDKRQAMRDLGQFLKMFEPESSVVNVNVQLLAQVKLEDREALLGALRAMLPQPTVAAQLSSPSDEDKAG